MCSVLYRNLYTKISKIIKNKLNWWYLLQTRSWFHCAGCCCGGSITAPRGHLVPDLTMFFRRIFLFGQFSQQMVDSQKIFSTEIFFRNQLFRSKIRFETFWIDLKKKIDFFFQKCSFLTHFDHFWSFLTFFDHFFEKNSEPIFWPKLLFNLF